MKKVLVIGAGGQIARVAIRELLERTDCHLTLFARRPSSIEAPAGGRVDILAGDALDAEAVRSAVRGQDVVYVNLSGALDRAAQVIVEAMEAEDVQRLVLVSSMGIHDEIPGEHHGAVLDPYRAAAKAAMESTLDWTVIRPAWLDDSDEIAYGLTHRDDPFVNADRKVSRRSVADLVVRLVQDDEGLGHRDSLGVHHP